MLFGFSSFAEQPFSTASDSNEVTIQVLGNALSISIGSAGITTDAIVENLDPNRLTLGTGSITISADANLSVTGNATALNIGSFIVTAGATANVTKNSLTLDTGNVTVTGTALVNPTGSQLTAKTGGASVITWEEIVPGVDMTWTEIST